MTTERKPLSGIVAAASGNNDDIFDKIEDCCRVLSGGSGPTDSMGDHHATAAPE